MTEKPSAEALSVDGDKYLGRSYDEMDCQKFVEHCLSDVGIKKDLPGSNAWFREMTWTGSPEECVKRFRKIPKGAFLFIHAFDGGEEKCGYHDGLGNASHIGIKTGRGDGAIHSSESKKCVATSIFRDKSIRGGWNMIGLWNELDYGDYINTILSGSESVSYIAYVRSDDGFPVRMRQKPTKKSDTIHKFSPGTQVTVISDDGAWAEIIAEGLHGYMMSEFLSQEQDDGQESEIDAGIRQRLIKIYDELGDVLGLRG